MFAVPGWSVSSSSLKTQAAKKPDQETASNTTSVAPPQTVDKTTASSDGRPGSKKRKRDVAIQKNAKATPTQVNVPNVNVTATNVADLWESVIEGKPKAAGKSSTAKHAEKRQKIRDRKNEEKKAEDLKKSEDVNITKGENQQAGQENGGQDLGAKKPKKGKTLKEKKREMKADALGLPAPTSTAADDKAIQTSIAAIEAQKPKLTPLQASMRQKLISARFRHLNQTLYTTSSNSSLELFSQNPEMFDEYHEGFRRQVEVWPQNPVDVYLELIQRRAVLKAPKRGAIYQNKNRPVDDGTLASLPLPRTEGTCNIIDLGCGDAKLATGLQKASRKLHLKISSFDLQSPSPLVTKADIANLPLADDSVDVAVFCLALMGTNWVEFIEEAYRVLHWKGELWIAEIKSRFSRASGPGVPVEHSVGNRKRAPGGDNKKKGGVKGADEEANEADLLAQVVDAEDAGAGRGARQQETDVSSFIEVLRNRGFLLQQPANPNLMDVGGPNPRPTAHPAIDLSNKMFVRMSFVKGTPATRGKCARPGAQPAGADRFTANKGSWVAKKPKFLDRREQAPEEDENAVLKPCVYKLR